MSTRAGDYRRGGSRATRAGGGYHKMPLNDLGRTLLIVGVALAALGGALLLAGQIPWLGRLPGDISFERGNFRFYAPIATMLLLSLIVTIVLNLFARR
jgi:Protein of unknown function (DUF2905)